MECQWCVYTHTHTHSTSPQTGTPNSAEKNAVLQLCNTWLLLQRDHTYNMSEMSVSLCVLPSLILSTHMSPTIYAALCLSAYLVLHLPACWSLHACFFTRTSVCFPTHSVFLSACLRVRMYICPRACTPAPMIARLSLFVLMSFIFLVSLFFTLCACASLRRCNS